MLIGATCVASRSLLVESSVPHLCCNESVGSLAKWLVESSAEESDVVVTRMPQEEDDDDDDDNEDDDETADEIDA